MSRGMRVAITLVVGIPLILIAGGVYLALQAEKSYEFPRVDIDASVLPDGSLELVERRTFAFDGRFSFAFFTVDWPVDQIVDFEVTENGRSIPVSTAESSSFQFKAHWEFDAQDEQRTFSLSYRVLCAVDVWADTAHLNWRFIGTGWDVPTERAVVRVRLPGVATGKVPRATEPCPAPAPSAAFETRPLKRGEARAWGHGPLGGEVSFPHPSTIELGVEDLPAATFVEGSILFPKKAVPLAYDIPTPMREQIVATEGRLAEEANDVRRRLLADERTRAARRRALYGFLAAEVLLFVAAAVISRRRDRVPGVPKTLQEPPEDMHPVDLAQLWSVANGRHGTHAVYRTQMLHLTSIGAIELQAVGPVSRPKDFRVTLRELKDANPRDMEFLEFLFPEAKDDGDGVSLRSLRPTGKRRSELKEWWDALSDRRRRTVRRIAPAARWESIAVTTVGIAGLVASFIVPGFVGPIGLLLLPVSLIGMLVANAVIRPRLGERFRERVARWRAFRRFLKEFSTFEEAPALAVTIWEHYLVYATALGVADEVEKQVKALIPAEELPRPWATAPSGLDSLYFVRSFHSVPVHTSAAVTSSSMSSGIGSFSSGGGFGGGFSGGGGGGGGGTGGGAG